LKKIIKKNLILKCPPKFTFYNKKRQKFHASFTRTITVKNGDDNVVYFMLH